jgi:YidC/Oxa1 family membrane protein insertase
MGFLNPLYSAVAWVMAQIHTGLSTFLPSTSGAAWFLTIVLLVVAMRLILVPLFVKQMHSMRKMSALTPQLQELRKKYKNDKQTLNEETMKVYREAGVNPLGGCLPLVAQLPIFFALFNVLRGIANWKSGPTPYGLTESVVKSAQHANILGAHISDKVLFTGTMIVPLHAKLVILAAVAISVATTFLTVRQSTKRGMTPQMTPDNPMAASQKYMAYIVPFFALSGLYWAFGLVLYWVTTNVWTLGQQYVLFKRYPATAPDAAGAAASSPAVPGRSAAATGLVAGSKPPGSRPAADAVKRPAPAKPGAAKPDAARPAGPKPGTAAKPAPARSGAAKPAAARASASPGQSPGKKSTGGAAQRQGRPAGQEASANGSGSASGLLRRFGKGRAEAEEQPAAPEPKLVRQQRVRQSRSKRKR